MSVSTSYPITPSQASIQAASPLALPVRFDSIPIELQHQRTFVDWRYSWNAKKGKWDKPPYDPNSNRFASVSDPSTWGNFAQAEAAYNSGGFAGIGIVFTNSGPYFGVDLDNCRNPITGSIERWALEIIRCLNSYTEISPSGTGLKIIGRGTLPPGRRVKPINSGKIEMYDTGRFFALSNYLKTGIV